LIAIRSPEDDDEREGSRASQAPLKELSPGRAGVLSLAIDASVEELRFRLLGPLEVRSGGRALRLASTKQRSILCLLLLHANEIVPTEHLIDALWGDRPPATANHTIQVHVSELRRTLRAAGAGEPIVTRPPGYTLELSPEQLDLAQFERLAEDGLRHQAADEYEAAARVLRQALALWRGPALADFVYEPFAEAAIGRLEELRLATLEQRIEADLALGHHAALVGELESLNKDNPLRERLRGQLMLALYRAGRQAEALEVYQDARRVLVGELGIEPNPALQRLEKAILNQDPSLDLAATAAVVGPGPPEVPAPDRSILVVLRESGQVDPLLALAEPLAQSRRPHELILVHLVDAMGDADLEAQALAQATAEVHDRRAELLARRVAARAAAFTSADWASDSVRLTWQQDFDLLLLEDRGLGPGASDLSAAVRLLLEKAPCDVALLAGRGTRVPSLAAKDSVMVPFGGGEHDWAALELAAWLGSARRVPLKLLGTAADLAQSKRDASRLLGNVSLAVQQLAGVAAEPLLVPAGAEGVLRAAEDAGLLVLGLSPRWRQEGLGTVRWTIASRARAPTVLVRRGLRPGGLAPREGLTRFTWSISAASEPA
jgi:DNA-binding SARP family transcriptional activator